MPGTWIALYIVLWCAVALVLIICLGLARKVRELEAAVPHVLGDMPHMDLAPSVGSVLDDPVRRALDVAAVPGGVVALFVSQSCGPCVALERELSSAGMQEHSPQLAERLVLAVDTEDGFRGIPALNRVVDTGEVRDRADIRGTPVALWISETGMVVETMASPRASDLIDLVSRAGADVSLSTRLVSGTP